MLDWTMQVGLYVSKLSYYEGCVLFIETSEEIPAASYVYRVLRTRRTRHPCGRRWCDRRATDRRAARLVVDDAAVSDYVAGSEPP